MLANSLDFLLNTYYSRIVMTVSNSYHMQPALKATFVGLIMLG
jgi:hypothetical protein